MLDSRREAAERRNAEQARRLQEMNDETAMYQEQDSKEAKHTNPITEQERFAAFESAALGEW